MSESQSILEQTLQSGIQPFTLLLSPVKRCTGNDVFAYRSCRIVNSLDMGVLYPSQYRYVCERTQQCVRLALSDIEAAASLITRMQDDPIGYEWVSVHIPSKLLLKDNVASAVDEVFTRAEFRFQRKICFEISADVLFEDYDAVLKAMNSLKKLEIKLAMTDFGGDFCPVNRMSGLPLDFCVLEPSVTEKAATHSGAKALTALMSFVHINQASVIAEYKGNPPADELSDIGCSGMCGWEGSEQNWSTYENVLAGIAAGNAL